MRGKIAEAEAELVGKPDRKLVPILVRSLRPWEKLGFDLYLWEEGNEPVLYREAAYPVEQDDLDRLAASGIEKLYIRSAAQDRYALYLQDHAEEILADDEIPLDTRCMLLYESSTASLAQAFRLLNPDRAIEQASAVGDHVIDLFAGQQLLIQDMHQLLRHDRQFFTRMINVSAYAVVLAERLGFRDPDDLQEVAVGALLHDIGLRSVPGIIKNKKHSLTPEERQQMQRHPKTGFEELCRREDLTWGQLMMVYQHHERCDGGGYPTGVVHSDIHWMARLCAVADVFESMSSGAARRRAIEIPTIFDYLREQAGGHFDAEMVRCFTDRRQSFARTRPPDEARAARDRRLTWHTLSGQLAPPAGETLGDFPDLPEEWDDIFSRRGPLPKGLAVKSRYTRYYYPTRAMLQTADHAWRIYTHDIARDGLCFLNAEPLFPGEYAVLFLAEGDVKLQLEIGRCLRIDDRCYEIGGRFRRPEDARSAWEQLNAKYGV